MTNTNPTAAQPLDLDTDTLWYIHGVVKNSGTIELAHKIADAIAGRAALIAQARAAHPAESIDQPIGHLSPAIAQPESATGTTGAILSIDTPEFRKLVHNMMTAFERLDSYSGKQFIAHIDAIIGDLRAQLASERQSKEYEQRHAVESETALAQAHAQLAANGQGEPCLYARKWELEAEALTSKHSLIVSREVDGDWSVPLYLHAPASAQPADPQLLAEIRTLATSGMCHGLLADDYCSQIIAKLDEASAQPAEERCSGCDGTGDVHTPTGEWLGPCSCQVEEPVDEQPDRGAAIAKGADHGRS